MNVHSLADTSKKANSDQAPKLSDFILKKKLGEGSYSQVSLVTRKFDNQDYALKQVNISRLNDKERENALNEVRFLASIRHESIIGYRAAFIDEGSLCIVMEYANDGDLLGKINDHKKRGVLIGENEIWGIFVQLLQGLQCLHRMQIMHRDLKPANIFLWKGEANGLVAKIGDMNVSKKAQQNGLNYTQTGTPYYASPEVWRDQPYDFKSDIWSLGCILFEMASLRPPFQAQDMDSLYKKVLKGAFAKIPSVYSQELTAMIKQMLVVDSTQRASVHQLLETSLIQAKTNEVQYSSIRKSQGNSINQSNSCSLIQTIRDTKDLKTLRKVLPKPNFDTNEEVDTKVIITSDQKHLITQRPIRQPSASQKSSLSLLARNQSQKVLNNKSRKQQIQILPQLQKNTGNQIKILQKIRDSTQLQHPRFVRNLDITGSYNSLEQEGTQVNRSLSYSKHIKPGHLERALSEQKLQIPISTPSQNILPSLSIVEERCANVELQDQQKKMDLQKITKKVKKQSNTQLQDISPNSSPMRQYGAVNTSMKTEQTSLNGSIVKKSIVAKKNTPLTQRPQLLSESSITNQRYASNIHLETETKKIAQRLSGLNDDLNRKFQLKLQQLKEGRRNISQRVKLTSVNSQDDESNASISPRDLGLRSRVAKQLNILREPYKQQQSLNRDLSILSLQSDGKRQDETSFYDHQKPDHNSSALLNPLPKMKPVKVIPSGKRRKTPNQLLGQIQNNLYMPQIQQAQALSQLQTLRQSNSQLSLHPLSLIKSKAESNLISQHTTVQQSIVLPPQHYVRVLSNNQIIKTNDEILQKKSLSSLNQQPSIAKLSMIPLRQQLYMDERNPFLDEGTKVMKSSSKLKLGTPIILNMSDNNIHLSKQHDAPSHLYQLQPLNTSNQRHKRNSSSLEYGNGQLIPNSVKSVQQINFGLLPPTLDNQRQLQELIENRGPLMNSAPMGITESSRHKSRINLLEKARKIKQCIEIFFNNIIASGSTHLLEEQSGKQNNQVSSFEAKISTATNSSRKKRQSTNDQ